MRTHSALFAGLAAAVATVSASEIHGRQDAPRATSPCETQIFEHEDAINAMPTPPMGEDWESFLLQQTQAAHLSDQPCAIAEVTGDESKVSEYSSLATALTSWLGSYSDELQSVLSACHDDPQYGPFITQLDLPIHSNSLCASYSLQAQPAETGNGDESDEESESESPGDAAPRQTGVAVAAVAAAGFAVVNML